jgi:hypothetical protein
MCDIFDYQDLLGYPKRLRNTVGDKRGDSAVYELENGVVECWVVFYDKVSGEPYRVLEENSRSPKIKRRLEKV